MPNAYTAHNVGSCDSNNFKSIFLAQNYFLTNLFTFQFLRKLYTGMLSKSTKHCLPFQNGIRKQHGSA